MDYRDAERDGDDDSPLCDPESGEPKAPPAQAFYVGYTARMLEDSGARLYMSRVRRTLVSVGSSN